MNILITGGAGFIGSNLTKHFLKNPDNIITIIDNLSTNVDISGMDIRNEARIQFIDADLAKPTDMQKIVIETVIHNANIVYHLAGSVGVKYVDNDPSGTLQNSFNINNYLFPLFEKHNKKVVFASTSEVYGNTTEAKETDVLKIGSPDKMRWGYACAKLMSEFLLKSYTFPNVIVRFFNVTGVGQIADYGMVMPSFIEKGKKGIPLTVYGDGEQTRTFCDIRDAVEMLDILGMDDIHNNEIYNIGNPDNSISIGALARMISLRVEFKAYEDEFSDEFDEIYERKPNTDKMQQYYKCKYSLLDIVESMEAT